jgi:ribonuclease HI
VPTTALYSTPAGLDWSNIAAVYADGGVIGPNPSAAGGTWAFCFVDAAGDRLWGASGHVTPAEIGLPAVTNNLTELLALLLALEPLPAGWAGRVFTDSLVTLRRFTPGGKKFAGIPADLVGRVIDARTRLGAYSLTLLGGHPNRAELAAGVRKDGLPVSAHNVWCDKRCGEEAAAFRRAAAEGGAA